MQGMPEDVNAQGMVHLRYLAGQLFTQLHASCQSLSDQHLVADLLHHEIDHKWGVQRRNLRVVGGGD
jgi:hypothetical protein